MKEFPFDIDAMKMHIGLLGARKFYRPEWTAFTGSASATLLLNEIIACFGKNNEKDFYRFTGPCDHPMYLPGDSFMEELGFSIEEFEKAIDAIAQDVTGWEDSPVSNESIVYYYHKNGLIYYGVNADLLEKKLILAYKNTCYAQRR